MPGISITRTEIALVGVALLVRAIYFASSTTSVYFNHPVLDAVWIHQWAQSLAAGDPQPAVAYFRAPLYPYLVSAVYGVVGATPWVVAALQHLLGAMMVGLLYRLGRRVAGEAVGVVAASLLSFYWVAVFFEGELLIVTLASALGLAFLTVLAAASDAPRGRARTALLFGAGLLLGAAAIARPNFLVLVPLALGWPILASHGAADRIATDSRPGADARRDTHSGARVADVRPERGGSSRNRRVRWRELAVITLAIALPILPVAIRNVVVAGDPVLIASQGGLNLYVGNGPLADGKTATAPGEVPPQARDEYQSSFRDNITLAGRAIAEAEHGRELNASEVSRFWLEKTWAHAVEAPDEVLRGLVRKSVYLLNAFEISDNRDLREAQVGTPWLRACFVRLAWVLPFSILGVLIVLKRFQKPHIIVYYTLLYSFSIVLFFVNARMRLPIAPGLFILAAVGMTTVASFVRRTDRWRSAQGAGIGAILLLSTAVVNARPFDIDARRAVPAFRLNRAFLLLEMGDCEGAMEAYDALVRESPEMLQAAYQRARAKQRCGDLEGALEAFTDVVTRWPEAEFAHLERGRVLDDLGRTEAAAGAFRAGIEVAAGNPHLHFALGLLELRRQAYPEAAAAYRRGLALEPTELSAWFNYGYTLMQLGQLDRASQAFQRVIVLAPDSEAAVRARSSLAQIQATKQAPAREGGVGEGDP